MATPLEQKLSVLAEGAAAAHGLQLVQARLAGSGKFLTLQVLVENPDGSSPGMDDCARASRTLSAQLDVADLINGRYVLEVSSPGLERPLINAGDYRRFIGRQAKLSFAAAQPVGDQKLGAVVGHIIAADDAEVTLALKDDGSHQSFGYGVIRSAQLAPSAEELALFMKREPLPGEVVSPPREDEPELNS